MTPEHAQVLSEIKSLLTWNAWLLGVISVLIVVVLVRLLFKVTHSTAVAPTILSMAQRHGEITDCRFDRYEERQQRLETRLMWLEGVLMKAAGGEPPRSAQLLAVALLCLLFGGFATVAQTIPKVETADPPPAVRAAGDDLTTRGWAAMRTGDHRTAAELLERAADRAGDPVLTLGAAAECHFYLKNYKEALDLCDRLEATDPTAGRSHYLRGLVLLGQGKREAAREELRTAARRGESLAAAVIPRTL